MKHSVGKIMSTLSVEFAESHLSTKLARVVEGEGTPDGNPSALPPGLDATLAPFVREPRSGPRGQPMGDGRV